MKKFLEKYGINKSHILLGLASILILLGLYITDPNDGIITLQFFQQFTLPIIAVWFAYIIRKVLFDYIDLSEMVEKAKETAVGAGLIFVGVCLVTFALLGLFGTSANAQDVKTYIPTKAHIYIPTVISEQQRLWANHPKDNFFLV